MIMSIKKGYKITVNFFPDASHTFTIQSSWLRSPLYTQKLIFFLTLADTWVELLELFIAAFVGHKIIDIRKFFYTQISYLLLKN